jgi:molybdopterin molybdotransferase
MMDGYVIREDAQPGPFRVVGEIPAGALPDVPLKIGEAMRIFTGAVLPPEGGRVVMQEECEREDDRVTIQSLPESLFIRRKASEAKSGDPILKKGTRIGAAEMAILAQVGCVNPMMIRKPSIRHLATGEELVAPDQRPTSGQIRDSNSSLIAGLLTPFGLPLKSTRTGDDPEEISKATEGEWDMLLISGGASVGDHDHGADVLRKAGFTIHFDKVNLRPGKPLTFATRGSQVAFVIPGNPVSHFVCFHVAIRLTIEVMCGIPPRWDFLDLKITSHDIIKHNPRETFWPARVTTSHGNLTAEALSWSTSGNTFSLAETNALIRVGESPPLTLLLDLPHPNQSI